MFKRLIVSTLVCAGMIAISPASALANKPARGCTENFTLDVTSNHPGSEAIDKNGDGMICFKPIPSSGGTVNVIDNTSNH